MASASPSTPPPLKIHDVVVPIAEEEEASLVDTDLRGQNGYDRGRGTTTPHPGKDENPPVLAQNSFHISESTPTPMLTGLWREVSSAYLQGLEHNGDDGRAAEHTRKKGRHKNHPKSFDFDVPLDPPTKLIENFLQQQAATGNLCLDMDVDMIEKYPNATIAKDVSLLPPGAHMPDMANCNPQLNEMIMHPPTSSSSLPGTGQQATQQRTRAPTGGQIDNTLVFKDAMGNSLPKNNREHVHDDERGGGHSSSDDESTIRRRSVRSSLNHSQTRSRLADRPPLAPQADPPASHMKSGAMKSGLQRSRMLGKFDEDEDDPFKDADIPESLRKNKCGFSTILQWIAFILIMGWLVCSLTIPALAHRPLWSMSLWKWALLTFLLFCGRLVSGWVIRILVMIIERNFLLRKRVLYFVYGLRKGVQNCLWFALAVLAWRLVFDPKVESYTNSKVLPYVTKILNCLLIAAIVWLVKIFFVKVLASSFHVSTYFERIRESLFGQWVLETLAGPPAIEIEQEAKLIEEINVLKNAGAKAPEAVMPKPHPQAGKSGMAGHGVSGLLVGGMKSGMMKSGMMGAGKSGFMGMGGLSRLTSETSMDQKTPQHEGITIDDLHKLNQRNISAWNMKRLMNFVRYRGIYTLVHVIDQTAAENQGDPQEMAVDSEWQAKALAKKIFKNVAKPGSRYITRDDLLRFMLEPELQRAWPLFEGALETKKISRTALKDFAVRVVRERRALSLSLNDTKTAVKKLHRIVDVVVGLIIVIVFLLVLGLATTHLLVVISSQLVLVVFIFGNTCKNVFEAIVFLFVMHPFDVGDRCVVDGNQLVVEEMNILSTLFVKNDGENIWYPNSLLAMKYIFNYRREPDLGDTFDFSIDASTPSDKIHALETKIAKYCASKPNHWKREFNLLVQSIDDNNKMSMRLQVNHTINFNEDLERQVRKSELILEVKKMLQELDIGYRLLPQEVHLTGPLIDKEGGGVGVGHHLKAA